MTLRSLRVFCRLCLFNSVVLALLTFAARAKAVSDDSIDAASSVTFNSVTTPNISAISSLGADSESDIWATSSLNSSSLHFNGTTWNEILMAKASFVSGVAVVSSTNVWAVGQATDTRSQIQHFNGSTWKVFSSPHFTAGDALNSVKAISSSSIFAVGSVGPVTNRTPLVEHFNGSTWNVVSVPKVVGGELFDLAIISPTDIWAVGSVLGSSTGNPALALHFDGKQWTQIKTPVNAGLFGVTALATNNVWAVGGQISGPVIEHWDGKSWKVVSSPAVTNPAALTSISAISATDIWAAGCTQCGDADFTPALVEHWNGTAWSVNPTPNEGSGGAANAVLAFPSKHIFVGGLSFLGSQAPTLLLEGIEGQ